MWRSYLHLAQLVFGWYLFAITISPLPCVSAEPSSLAFMVEGQARFQVLAPMLVRMEYSPTARFIDAPSVAVLKRDWPTIPIQTRRVGGWREIETGKMTIRYRIGSGLFTAENLQVRWKNEQGDHVWKPGDKDDKNLGGVPAGDISHRIEPGNEPGALSRNGYFFSTTAAPPCGMRQPNGSSPGLRRTARTGISLSMGVSSRRCWDCLANCSVQFQ